MRTIVDVVRPGSHACAVLDSVEQGWETLSAFVNAGLAGQDRVLLVGLTDEQAGRLVQRLRDDGTDPDPAVRGGQLVMMSDPLSQGFFDLPTQDLTGQLVEQIESALRAGYRGTRLSGLYPKLGVAPHETALAGLVTERAVTVFCPYLQAQVTAGHVARLRELHDSEVQTPAIFDDGLLRITRPRPGRLRLAGRMDASNRGIALAAITTAARAGDRDLDMASLQYIDPAGLHALLTCGIRGLRLRRPGPLVRRLALLLAEHPDRAAHSG